jgi:succinyl-CoA synthetase beta subunit
LTSLQPMQYAEYLMRLYEYEGADLFRHEGIPVPDFALAENALEARNKASDIGLPVILKAQVLTGGRWLAGGVHTAETLNDVEESAARLFTSKIRDLPIKQLMVVHKVNVQREYYLSISVDDYNGIPIAILSAEGGVSINATTKKKPEVMVSRPLSMIKGLRYYEVKQMCSEVGLSDTEQDGISPILLNLYNVFKKYDALIAEINPLVKTSDNKYVALDSKVEIDDSSLYRHTDLNIKPEKRVSNPLERKGKEIGVTYVELDGDIAMISSGAGLGMASMDIMSQKMRPANFLETGGAITDDLLYKVTELVLQKPGIRALFINIYGGINPINEGAKGIVRYLKEHNITIPVLAKALGNNQEETWQTFRQGGVHVVDGVSTESGIEQLMHLLGRDK